MGQKQTSRDVRVTSALPPIADIQPAWISPPESQRQLDEERPAESTT